MQQGNDAKGEIGSGYLLVMASPNKANQTLSEHF